MKWLNKEMMYDRQDRVFRYVVGNEIVDVKNRTLIYSLFWKYNGIGMERLILDEISSLLKATPFVNPDN